jgi:hydroxymethylpyrimidine/phosphomethylpyrimidine kinase
MTGTPIALTIAGSDSSGGAGIQADLKTFSAFGVYGASVITALTAQNTLGVTAIEPVAAAFVAAQMEAVLSDLAVGAIKTGMLANAGIIEAVAGRLRDGPRRPLVVDPVMVATSGDVLLEADAVDALKRELFPQALLITPNLPEAARLLDAREATSEAEVIAQVRALLALRCHAVLLKGGHGSGEEAVDILCDAYRHRALRAPAGRHAQHARHGLHAFSRHHGPARSGRRAAARLSAARKPSSGKRCRRGALWASGMATGRSTTCSLSAALRRRLDTIEPEY